MYLISHNETFSIGAPRKGKRITEALNFVDNILGPDIPELDDTITTDAAKFCIFDRIECNFLNRSKVTCQES